MLQYIQYIKNLWLLSISTNQCFKNNLYKDKSKNTQEIRIKTRRDKWKPSLRKLHMTYSYTGWCKSFLTLVKKKPTEFIYTRKMGYNNFWLLWNKIYIYIY